MTVEILEAGADARQIAQQLSALGFGASRRTPVGGGPDQLGAALSEALDRSDVVVIAGSQAPAGDDAAPAAVSLLKARGQRVSVAESLTGGLVAAALVSVPGASNVLDEAHVTYADAAKHRVLGVQQETLDRFTAVSAQCAREMAEGVRRISGADWGASTTGYAGPDGGADGTPVGTVYIAVAGPDGTRVEACHFVGDRAAIRALATARALNALRQRLEAQERGGQGHEDL